MKDNGRTGSWPTPCSRHRAAAPATRRGAGRARRPLALRWALGRSHRPACVAQADNTRKAEAIAIRVSASPQRNADGPRELPNERWRNVMSASVTCGARPVPGRTTYVSWFHETVASLPVYRRHGPWRIFMTSYYWRALITAGGYVAWSTSFIASIRSRYLRGGRGRLWVMDKSKV
jgi:hypothetical protein